MIGIFATEFVAVITSTTVAIALATMVVSAVAMDMITKIRLLDRTSMGITGPAIAL